MRAVHDQAGCVVRGMHAGVSVVALCLAVCGGCNGDSSAPPQNRQPEQVQSPVKPQEPSSHEQMRAILAQIAFDSREVNDFVGDRHARQLRAYINDPGYLATLMPERLWELHFELAKAELKQGNETLALDLLRKAEQLLPPDSEPLVKKKTYFDFGMASLRYGETQNCCLRNSSQSCIVPIRGTGLHTRPEGSRQAIKYFTKVLELPLADDAGDEERNLHNSARWLLNIAHMTLDEYPDGVPIQFRVSPEFFKSEIEFPQFVNVYPKLKLNTFNLCGGAVVDDLDGDLDLDIATSTWDVTGQDQIFRNNGDGTFDEVTEEAGLKGFFGGLNMNQADFDNDGDLDLYIMRGAWLREDGLHPNSLLRNDGHLKFTDVTFDVGLGQDFLPTKTSAWADYDNDGDLDLYVGNETTPEADAPCRLYRNDGGMFVNVAREAGVEDRVFSMGSAWGDFNGDRWPDLFLSIGGDNKLYRNNKDGTFTDVAAEAGVSSPSGSFPTWFWDYDNDGRDDIFVGVTSGTVSILDSDMPFEAMRLYHNNGDGTFEDRAEQAKLKYPTSPMGANFGDLNNDGYPDFYLATGNVPFTEIQPNVMFLNEGGQRFHNVTMAGGFGHLQKGHGVAFADIDNDLDQDVYVQLGGAYPADRFNDALFENPGFDNHCIALQLVGKKSNRCAIGARVRLDITEQNGLKRSVYHRISSGGSFGASPLRKVIGIGTATQVDQMVIEWPLLNLTQTVSHLQADRFYRIVENEKPEEIALKSFRLGGAEPVTASR